MRNPCTAVKNSPRSPQLEKARAQQRRPNAALKKNKKPQHMCHQACGWDREAGLDPFPITRAGARRALQSPNPAAGGLVSSSLAGLPQREQCAAGTEIEQSQ